MNSTTIPPRFVPTLTDVVHLGDRMNQPNDVNSFNDGNNFKDVNKFNDLDGLNDTHHVNQVVQHTDLQHSPEQLEDQIVHRVMQRVDLVLESRLREAIAQVILSHTHNLGPRLREEIELVVRESVSQAVAHELPLRRQVS